MKREKAAERAEKVAERERDLELRSSSSSSSSRVFV